MSITILQGDCRELLKTIDAGSVQVCVTSPPYFGLRRYLPDGDPLATQEIGGEETPAAYVAALVDVFRQVWRVLRDDGTCWLNLGDSYANDTKWGGTTGGKHVPALHGGAVGRGKRTTGLKPKDLIGIPWRVAFALQEDGWWLRSDIIWNKPNAMPESVTDRPTRSHEYLFLLSKSARYFYDADAIREPASPTTIERWGTATPPRKNASPQGLQAGSVQGEQFLGINPAGRNRRSVWTIPTSPYPGAHYAVMPEALVEPCILAGSRPGDTVLDPFAGSGTVLRVADRHGRDAIGIELNPEYLKQINERTNNVQTSLVGHL